MDKLIKQSIDARKNAFSASYKIDVAVRAEYASHLAKLFKKK
jgi:hypothetical protein